MSTGSEETRARVLGALGRELRQLPGLSTSYLRAAAARIGMSVTDLQVLDFLESTGPLTAGQLADLTGLTTGAITGMLNRLEEAGLVCRERDPNDGRRVIVRLASGKEGHGIVPLFTSLGEPWEELASRYDDEQLAFLLTFLKSSNALFRQELVRLRAAPKDEDGTHSAPLGDVTSGRLIIPAGGFRLIVRAGSEMAELFRARFEGATPDVKTKDGVVTIRYPRRLWLLAGGQRGAEITLNIAIPWSIAIQGGGSELNAQLDGLDLAGLEVNGGGSTINIALPVPSRAVPIRISGGGSMITLRRPAGVAARVHLKGWGSAMTFDEQTVSGLDNDVRLQSRGYDGAAPSYDVEVASSGSMVTITSG